MYLLDSFQISYPQSHYDSNIHYFLPLHSTLYHQQLPNIFWHPIPQAKTPAPQLPSTLQHSSIKDRPLYPLQVVPPFLLPHRPFLLAAAPIDVGAVAVVEETVMVTTVVAADGEVSVAVLVVVASPAEVEFVATRVSDDGTEPTELESTDEPPQLPKSVLQPVPQ